ncbi:hypothetical protein D1007_35912 [Hordeum vulgare]|nr:hypothetical protein D1007_35912 [Hordeum vulgare]
MATTVGAPHLPVPVTTVASLPAVLAPEEIIGAIYDITTVVQGIRFYMAGPYGPPPVAPTAANGPPHQAAAAALARPLLPALQLSPPPSNTSGPALP